MIQDQHLDKVLQTVQSHTEEELPAVILEAKDWCHLYHLSKARVNLIEWIEIGSDEEVLEFGAECGALTGFLAEKAGAVTALELDAVKTEINRNRHRLCRNITYICGGLERLKIEAEGARFDKIFLIGSLPLAELYMGKKGDGAYAGLLGELKGFLKPEGRMFLAAPNRLGLKYFAGCREDYFGAPFTGLEDYYYHKGMRTFGKKELSGLLTENGFPEHSFYYPYPDYRFMTQLFSDERLPKAGELHTNLVNFDQGRYVFFDETLVYDGLVKEQLFPELANSFLVVTGKEPVSDLIYAKYSYERADAFQLRTDLRKNRETKEWYAKKVPLSPASADHVEGIQKISRELAKAYQNSGIEICPCGENVVFPYVSGQTLQEKIESLVIEARYDEVKALIWEYCNRMKRNCKGTFRETKEFRQVFGRAWLPWGLKAMDVSDIDLIFSNIILTEEGGWKVIDYEWTFSFPVPLHFILYRAFFFASHQIRPCEALSLPQLLSEEGITEREQKEYEKMESTFQRYVTGGRMQERDLLIPIGNEILPFAELDKAYRERS